MDFKQLRSFVTVADCGSFTQAAVRLYTSQPTVSAHIRQLEDELHETLFLRTTKSLAITARGQELYDYAVHVLELQDQLLDAWAQDEHTIRLGASTIPSAYILPEVLPPFRAQHPDAVFSVLQSDSAGVLQQLRAGRSLYLVWRKNGALLCVVPRMEASRLKKIVSECDAHAFVTVCDVHEALGEGFSYHHIS
mgnify:CR=1 FL=1